MARTILGALAGVVTTYLTIMLIEFAGQRVYPPPPGLDPTNTGDMARIIGMMPPGALMFMVVAWIVGALDGGIVAALIARGRHPRIAAIVPALLVIAGVVGMMVMMPGHPAWMAIAGLLLPIPAALAGAWLVRGRARAD
jgi:hypothetical protein